MWHFDQQAILTDAGYIGNDVAKNEVFQLWFGMLEIKDIGLCVS